MPVQIPPAAWVVILVAGAALILALAAWRLEPRRRGELIRQFALIVPFCFAYFAIRAFTEGGRAEAIARAHALADFERAIGIEIEPWLNELTVRWDPLTAAANIIYIWGHWPVILVVAVWLFGRHPREFRVYRNAFLVSGTIGIFLFYLLPTAPPRLADAELIDTVAAQSRSYRLLQSPLLTNQYAAFPSLHVGWNLLIGIALARTAGSRVARMLGWISPGVMALAAVATANHYVVDLAAGAVVALTGLAVAVLIEARRDRTSAAAVRIDGAAGEGYTAGRSAGGGRSV